jgi:alpha-ketoglutaric semialdehyde dehydrogenase
MIITGNNLIGFSQSAQGKRQFKSQIQCSEKDFYSFYEATSEEVHESVNKANIAFSIYKGLPYTQRALFLESIADEIVSLGSELIRVTMQETNLTEARLTGERDRTTNQLRFFAEILRDGSWLRAIIDKPMVQNASKPDIRQMQIPLGAVGVWGASNFPFAFSVAGGDTVSALAAGCTVIHKAHPAHPVTCELIGGCILKAAQKTGMPDGVFSLLNGENYEIGLQIVRHPLIKAVAFTGSFPGGKALYDEACKRENPIPVYAEMGSVNPVFILPGILNERGTDLAKSLAASNLLGAGQFCTNPGVVVLPTAQLATSFMNDFKSAIESAPAELMLTVNIHSAFNRRVKEFLEHDEVELFAKNKGREGHSATPQAFTVSAKTFVSQGTLGEEIFGPSSIHVATQNKEELLEVARSLQGQLTATIWGNEGDLSQHSELIEILQEKAGRLIFNAMPTGVEVNYAMVHGGPFPAATNSSTTSVGSTAIYRFTRPVCFQGFPQSALPEALQDSNPLRITRQINGQFNN